MINAGRGTPNCLPLVIQAKYKAVWIPVEGRKLLGYTFVPQNRLGLVLEAGTCLVESGVLGISAHQPKIVNSARDAVIATECGKWRYHPVSPNETATDQLRTKKTKICTQRIWGRGIRE